MKESILSRSWIDETILWWKNSWRSSENVS